jgi:hypothetical protein
MWASARRKSASRSTSPFLRAVTCGPVSVSLLPPPLGVLPIVCWLPTVLTPIASAESTASASCHRRGPSVFAGTLAVPPPECQQSQVRATVRGGDQSVVRRRILDRKSAASREQIFLLSYAVVPEPKRTVESGRRISPSVDLQEVAEFIGLPQLATSLAWSLEALEREVVAEASNEWGLREMGGRRTSAFCGLAVLAC